MRTTRLACTVLVAALLAGCGDGSTSVKGDEGGSGATTTTTAAPDDKRLHKPFGADRYPSDPPTASSWRMDPAPEGTEPRLTEDQAIAAFYAGFSTAPPEEGETRRAWFGMFSGYAPNPEGPDGRLTGLHPIGPVPAWIVLADGVTMFQSGPAPGPGQTSPPREPMKGYNLGVVSDADGKHLSGVQQSSPAPHIE